MNTHTNLCVIKLAIKSHTHADICVQHMHLLRARTHGRIHSRKDVHICTRTDTYAHMPALQLVCRNLILKEVVQ